MKDHKGKRIVLGSTIKVINDVDYGREYKVDRWCDAYPYLCIHDENGCVLLLSTFAQENGCLIDFERI